MKGELKYMVKPIYDKNIIVGIKYSKKFNWYILDKHICFMDISSIPAENFNLCIEEECYKDIRKNYERIDSNNIESFLTRIQSFSISCDYLRLQILNKIQKKEELEEFYPALLFDFNKNILYSLYPEPNNFDEYILDNWIEKEEDFTELIEDKYKYWLYNNKNLFEIEI